MQFQDQVDSSRSECHSMESQLQKKEVALTAAQGKIELLAADIQAKVSGTLKTSCMGYKEEGGGGGGGGGAFKKSGQEVFKKSCISQGAWRGFRVTEVLNLASKRLVLTVVPTGH